MATAKINKDLDDVMRKIEKSNKIIEKGDSMGVKDAIKLKSKGSSIESTLRKSTKEYANVQVTDAEAVDLLGKLTKLVDLTAVHLKLMEKNKPVFDKLHVAGLVKKTLVNVNEAASNLAKMCVSKAPASITAESNALEARNNQNFKNTMAVYSGATGGEEMEGQNDDSD